MTDEKMLPVALPNGMEGAIEACKEIRAWKKAALDTISRNVAKIDEATFRAEKLNRFDGMTDAVKDAEAAVALAAAKATHAQELLVELAATRNEIRAAIKARQDYIRTLHDRNDPPEPVHTYVIRMTCTDRVLDGIVKKAAKDGAKDVLPTTPQSDKAVKQIMKWFEENV